MHERGDDDDSYNAETHGQYYIALLTQVNISERKQNYTIIPLSDAVNSHTETTLALQNGFLYGLLLSLLLGLTILISLSINPEIWVGDYPPDIKAAYTPVRSDTKRNKRIASLAFMIFLVGVLILSIVQSGRVPGHLSF